MGKHNRLSLVWSAETAYDGLVQPLGDPRDPGAQVSEGFDPTTRTVFCSQPGELFGDANATISAPEIEAICNGVKQLLTTHHRTDKDVLLADWQGWLDRPHHLQPSNPLMLAKHEVRDSGAVATLGVAVRTELETFSSKAVYVRCFNPNREDRQATACITRKYVKIETDPNFEITNTRELSLASDNPVRAGQVAAAFNFARLSLGQRAGAYPNIPRLGEGEYYLGIAELGLPLVSE